MSILFVLCILFLFFGNSTWLAHPIDDYCICDICCVSERELNISPSNECDLCSSNLIVFVARIPSITIAHVTDIISDQMFRTAFRVLQLQLNEHSIYREQQFFANKILHRFQRNGFVFFCWPIALMRTLTTGHISRIYESRKRERHIHIGCCLHMLGARGTLLSLIESTLFHLLSIMRYYTTNVETVRT